MAGLGDIVQKPIPTCDKHSSDEVEVYCKDCSKAICFECSRIHHLGHNCEGITKLSRTLRQQLPETCKQIREGTLSRMQVELESVQSFQIRSQNLFKEEQDSMEMLQERCIQTVKNVFKTKIEKSSEKLCIHNKKLNTREQELIQNIKKLKVHVQAHEDSHLTYGKYEIIEMDKKLKDMTSEFDQMDIKESIYIPFTPSHLSPDFMERLDSSLQSILLEFSEENSPRNRQFLKSSSESTNVTPTLKNSDSEVNSVYFCTAEGILVKVYSANITRLSVDCIVNAANDCLTHGAGVSGAISKAAGYEFALESRDYVMKNGRIPAGKCCTTGAGELPYKCVIHTVGPMWSNYNDKRQCEKVLRQAVEGTFREAVNHRCYSIALPAISSGVFGVPKEICAKQYYHSIISHSQSGESRIGEIHFVDKNQEMVDCIIKTFTECFNHDSQ